MDDAGTLNTSLSTAESAGNEKAGKGLVSDGKPQEFSDTNPVYPASADGYVLERPSEAPEGMTWSDADATGFRKIAHDLNLTQKQFQGFVDWCIKQESEEHKPAIARRGGGRMFGGAGLFVPSNRK